MSDEAAQPQIRREPYTHEELTTKTQPQSPQSQGLCDTTMTERFDVGGCDCPTYPDNLGPCATYLKGSNGRCVYCDHTEQCHAKVKSSEPPQNLDIIEDLKDLYKQATTERSHYYVASCCKRAIAALAAERSLRETAQSNAELWHEEMLKADKKLAAERKRTLDWAREHGKDCPICGTEENELRDHQAEAWIRVCALCMELGADHTLPGEVACEQIENFIKHLANEKAEAWWLEKLEAEQEAHKKTAKQLVDSMAIEGSLEKKLAAARKEHDDVVDALANFSHTIKQLGARNKQLREQLLVAQAAIDLKHSALYYALQNTRDNADLQRRIAEALDYANLDALREHDAALLKPMVDLLREIQPSCKYEDRVKIDVALDQVKGR